MLERCARYAIMNRMRATNNTHFKWQRLALCHRRSIEVFEYHHRTTTFDERMKSARNGISNQGQNMLDGQYRWIPVSILSHFVQVFRYLNCRILIVSRYSNGTGHINTSFTNSRNKETTKYPHIQYYLFELFYINNFRTNFR